ncbi:hypothetical protein ILUMI_19672 [Ignelater luminosus]|uniref:Uncharacterized protein n=1 Tax=Ignelater luminosus TaxID=2038154 RepID=A0A8K0G5D0_IGNLU|nr:hypothetical protein ILUMI_19672 [Ignelater luminosus]
MKVDSGHSATEKMLEKVRQVVVPADYLPIIQSSRVNKPYHTYYLSQDIFVQIDTDYHDSIRLGGKTGDPCVNEVVAFLE